MEEGDGNSTDCGGIGGGASYSRAHMTANAKGLQLRTVTFLGILGISITFGRNRLTKIRGVFIIEKTE